MLCRVAEDMFWLSRYVERAVSVARLIDVTEHLELDAGDVADEDDSFWAPLLDTSVVPVARDMRQYLAFDAENPNALVSCIRRARRSAQSVRECISSEMWEQLNTLYLWLTDSATRREADEAPHAFYKRVLVGAQLVQGLTDSTLAHDEPWHFSTLGKYLERADNVARMLRLESHLLTSDEQRRGDDVVRLLAVLRSCGSAEAYARYYSLRVEPARLVEFLLLNPVFPQSVRFSIRAAGESLTDIGSPGMPSATNSSPPQRHLGRLRTRLDYVGVDEIFEEGLDRYLADVQDQIAIVSESVTRSYLREEPQIGRLVAVARAVTIMAAQQQQ